MLMFRGDTVTFTMTLPFPDEGVAAVRTNLGHAPRIRREIIDHVDRHRPPLAEDWFDVPMRAVSDTVHEVTLPLTQVGHFDAKCYFLPKGTAIPVWPEGANTEINVEPADTCCGNIIYNAFIRQFGPNKAVSREDAAVADAVHRLDALGYTVIPPSGKFRDTIRELDFIMGELGCRALQLLPIHPVPTTYGRMGRFGSPYAALGFTEVDPAYAEFDTKATPLEQFLELVDAVHARNGKILIDIAINHTGWAARIHETHPEWLVRGEDGKIEVPGAWGVRWEDLTRLDYRYTGLWQYMADMFLAWCRRGVDGFRCDAGYMIPIEAWRYIIARVRDQYPDTLFNLEGLGGKISVTRDILNRGNMNWGYSELFQNYRRAEIEQYLPEAWEIAATDGIMVHFAETHDNNRLAATSQTYARLRTGLCALFSHNGAFAFANGVEWFATQKINVHEASSLNWGAGENQVAYLCRLHMILKYHPAFQDRTDLSMIQTGEGQFLVLFRFHRPTGKGVIIAVNLDDQRPVTASWRDPGTAFSMNTFTDLVTGDRVPVGRCKDLRELVLGPGQVRSLSPNPEDLRLLERDPAARFDLPPAVQLRRLRAKALEAWQWKNGLGDLGGFDPNRAARELLRDPVAFCRSLDPPNPAPPVVHWRWPTDLHREVMIAPGHFLLVWAPVAFRARITESDRFCLSAECSVETTTGEHFALFCPLPEKTVIHRATLHLTVYEAGRSRRADGPLVFLSAALETASVHFQWKQGTPEPMPVLMLATNGIGGMLRAPVAWGELTSRYDALLAANLNPDCPEDRWIMFSRCRGWVVYQGFSQELNLHCLDTFSLVNQGQGVWRFKVPTGQGEHVLLTIGVYMTRGFNAMGMVFHREPANGEAGRLPDTEPVELILRPDIEDRNFHDTTKASQGPETDWPERVTATENGFTFSPGQWRHLKVWMREGRYHPQAEWRYMIHRPLEAQRGLDPSSDLFSPGYFSAFIGGGATAHLAATVSAPPDLAPEPPEGLLDAVMDPASDTLARYPLSGWLEDALMEFVVKRGDLKSVVAGYPWFLDWGRDSLIVTRGLIETGRLGEARAILKQFGQFERNGTLPNMIRGTDAGNRDTSDAPLWFITACGDLVQKEGNSRFLAERCGERTVRQVLISIGNAMTHGLSNGVRMDPASALIFSPAHFSWMDTNHPAGSPRQGYPVEIQALWHSALSVLARIDDRQKDRWRKLASQARDSIMKLFYLPEKGHLCDCRHCAPGESALGAVADDALRPNQLFALTLGALTDKKTAEGILTACSELLVPGAIRSLADRAVHPPLPIWHHHRLLNDPNFPYAGKYVGDEDTHRKPAYHNGTAWTWPFPSFCEAWIKIYGEGAKDTARAWLSSTVDILKAGCIGQIPEILDGDAPHHPRGCDAQAWGASEWVRVWHLACRCKSVPSSSLQEAP